MHLPYILDCYSDAKASYVVMEYVNGRTLREAVRAEGSRQGREKLAGRLLPQLCDAACELHEGFSPKIIHRDIKPDNVIVSGDNVTLVDLGISRTFKEGEAVDTHPCATRMYAPPEQFGFGQTDARSDIYAIGMVYAFCLTGEDPGMELRQAVGEGAEALERQGFSREAAAVIARACAFDPKLRHGSARELKDAITSAAYPPPCGSPAIVPHGSPAPEDFGASRRVAPSLSDRLKRLAGMVPTGLGMAWNVVLFLALALMLYACTFATFVPTGEQVGYPLWFRVMEFYGTVFLFSLAVFIALSDVRLLRKHRPFRKYSRRKTLAAALMLFVVVFAATVFCYSVIA